MSGEIAPPTLSRCAFIGDEPLVAQCVQIAIDHGLDVVLVATTNDVVSADAARHGVATADPAALGPALDRHPADVLFSIANLSIVPGDVLARVGTAINFHDGPLPAYAGLHVTTWALLAGEREHAVTWHLMTDQVDGGEVVDVETFAVGEDETAFSLNARAYEAALASFPRVAAALAGGGLAVRPQPPGPRRLFRRNDRPAVLLDPTRPPGDMLRAVRALDLGHRLRNPIGSVRLVVGDAVAVVEQARLADHPSGEQPGTVVLAPSGELALAMCDGDLVLTTVSTPEGVVLDGNSAMAHLGIIAGSRIAAPPAALVAAIAEHEPRLAGAERGWLDHLARAQPTPVPWAGRRHGVAATATVAVDEVTPAAALAAVAAWLSRVAATPTVGVGVVLAGMGEILAATAPLTVPPAVAIDVDNRSFGELVTELAALDDQRPLLADAIGRDPRTRGRSVAAPVVVDLDEHLHSASLAIAGGVALHIGVGDGRLHVAVPDDQPLADRVAEQLGTVLTAGTARPDNAIEELPIVGPSELAMLDALNRTERAVVPMTIDAVVRTRVAATPDLPAVSFGGRTMTYRQLDDTVAAVGERLAAAGIGRADRVGIAVPRGFEMVAGVLATLELGAAYVPLDPTYPRERLRQMVADSGIKALIVGDPGAAGLAQTGCAIVDPSELGPGAVERRVADHEPGDLAYVIYTSGSTGVPKGVMLEHRQVTNFFAAMDEVIDGDPPGVWLAVTSLSFDISVLELLWTLSRGFHVVIAADRQSAELPLTLCSPQRPVSFSLFYFAAGEEAASDGYRLLRESAVFADRHGFEAVWTPERHFHAFGGAYPNPSVTGAALAAITDNVAIRAGSVVLPLHSPVRVAEEWAVVDNLSGGRVGISFAAGWQPDDFVLNPGAYATAKEDLPARIDTVRRLWRGETVALPGHDGQPVDVHTLPRPVQGELPTWLTSAGSPATFERAGTLGVNLLTHLLGQSIEQLHANIERYRAAWRTAGHPGAGHVTLMLHTYLAADAATARETARKPMKSYLRTAVGLLRDVASAFPTFAGKVSSGDDLFASLTADELDQLLEAAAQRYLRSSGLFGTPADAAALVGSLSEAGVDEVACLIDFGIATDDVLASLALLAQAKQLVDERHDRAGESYDTVAALAEHHRVTHLQCTPSLAAMLLADPADRAALERLRHLLVGGEALPVALATELRDVLGGRLTNMYGPTETTIWSLVHEVDRPPTVPIPIGVPIGNTSVFVLGAGGGRLPMGVFGELHIGGAGVARGYHERPELTAERFADRPGIGRVYATGDIARIHPAGYVEFGGRTDNQVKVRGHRIELGEVEAVLDRHADISQSVVVARGAGPDVQLVAFVVPTGRALVSAEAIRKHVAAMLPDVMVPAVVVSRETLPLTPNGKVDRWALTATAADPALGADSDGDRVVAPPADDAERLVARIWAEELERVVGRDDNFFDIGGHSLLAVKVFRRLGEATAAPLALTDVFRYPTVRSLAAHLSALANGAPAATNDKAPTAAVGTDRGAMRRLALARRGTPDGDE